MEEIGDALREVLGTNDKYKFTEIASSIKTCAQVFYLGEGMSFDVSHIPGYQNLTVDNFLIVPTKVTATVKVRQAAYGEYHSTSNSATIKKTYDASTGTLKISGCSVSVSDATVEASASGSAGGINVYLVKGTIKTL